MLFHVHSAKSQRTWQKLLQSHLKVYLYISFNLASLVDGRLGMSDMLACCMSAMLTCWEWIPLQVVTWQVLCDFQTAKHNYPKTRLLHYQTSFSNGSFWKIPAISWQRKNERQTFGPLFFASHFRVNFRFVASKNFGEKRTSTKDPEITSEISGQKQSAWDLLHQFLQREWFVPLSSNRRTFQELGMGHPQNNKGEVKKCEELKSTKKMSKIKKLWVGSTRASKCWLIQWCFSVLVDGLLRLIDFLKKPSSHNHGSVKNGSLQY